MTVLPCDTIGSNVNTAATEIQSTDTHCECGDKYQPCGEHVEVDVFNPCHACKVIKDAEYHGPYVAGYWA